MSFTNPHFFITIISMGIAVYITRIGGYWLAGRFRINHLIKAWLNYLPGCVIISIVAPIVLTATWREYLGCLIVIILMYKTNNFLLSMVASITAVAILRWL